MAALLIGINDYTGTGYSPLNAAEPDARRWRDFLVQVLKVPDSHITVLLGKSATRNNIINALIDLKAAHIEKGDPIFIFYAGHGDVVLTDESREMVNMIIPANFIKEKRSNGIISCEIGEHLSQISKIKGDNITVIMDCCNAASLTGAEAGSGCRALTKSILSEGPRINNGATWTSKPRARLESHILLAACTSTGKAYEECGYGEFSAKLLDLLRKVSLDHLRYCDILTYMQPLSSQAPQCEGVNINRIIFTTQTSTASIIAYSYFPQDGCWLRLKSGAGSPRGVTDDALFNIQLQTETSFKQPLQNIVLPMQGPGFIHFIPGDDHFGEVFKEVVDGEPDCQSQSAEDTMLITDIQLRGPSLLILIGSSHVPAIKLKDRRVESIIHHYKKLSLKASDPTLTNYIDLEFYKLGPSSAQRDSQNLTPTGPSLFRNGIIYIDVDARAYYGMKLINKGNRDLYPYIFYFGDDGSSIDIPAGHIRYYNATEAPLKKKMNDLNGVLTLGYGASSIPPWNYEMRKGSRRVNVLHIILTSQPVDLISIAARYIPFKRARGAVGAWTPLDEWCILCIPLVHWSPKAL